MQDGDNMGLKKSKWQGDLTETTTLNNESGLLNLG